MNLIGQMSEIVQEMLTGVLTAYKNDSGSIGISPPLILAISTSNPESVNS